MNLLELAKQGDAKAIAALMNRNLQSKGITAKTDLNNGCLQVILESTQVPEQQALVDFVYKGMSKLGVASIHKVVVYGQQIDKAFPNSSKEKAEAILGALFLVLLFGGCVHQIGYPWNCAEAREVVRKAQADYDDNYQRQLAKVYVDVETINSTYLKYLARSEAESKASKLCNK